MNLSQPSAEYIQQTFDYLYQNRSDTERDGWYSGFEICRATDLRSIIVYPALSNLMMRGVVEDTWFERNKDKTPNLSTATTFETLPDLGFWQRPRHGRFYRSCGQIALI